MLRYDSLLHRMTMKPKSAKRLLNLRGVSYFMQDDKLIPHLFRTEFRKITAVLCKLFGLEHIETAEDIASETFLSAFETWTYKGIPKNPTAWLYYVAKNKAKNYLQRNSVFENKIKPELKNASALIEKEEIDLSMQ